MHLIEILLPVADNAGTPIARETYESVHSVLTGKFGGLTAFTRAPAQGVVKYGAEKVHDDIVVLEVMAQQLDRNWWREFRQKLERDFAQDEIMIRATEVARL